MSYFDDNEDCIIYGRRHHVSAVRKTKSAPVGSALSSARILAHSAFDESWGPGKISRSAAYKKLAKQLGMGVKECHIINFDIATCERVVALYMPNEFEDIS
jgi:hypothetical protein